MEDGLCTARHYLVLQVISPDGYSGGAKGKVNQMFILAIDAKKKHNCRCISESENQAKKIWVLAEEEIA